MKKRKHIGLVLILILLSIIVSPVIADMFSYSEKDAWDELLALDSQTTMDTLTKSGYIDVSQPLQFENPKITNFFEKAKSGQNSVLRIAMVANDKLYAKILIYSRSIDCISMWTLCPNQQQSISPGKRFNKEPYTVNESDSLAFYLEYIPDTSVPNSLPKQPALDEKIYSLKNKSDKNQH